MPNEKAKQKQTTTTPTALWRGEDGQDLVEYSLLLAFLTLSAVALIQSTGASLKGLLQHSVTAVSSAVGTALS